MKTLKDCALWYQAQGFSIIPLLPKQKIPHRDLLPLNEEGKPTLMPFRYVAATREQVEAWWTKDAQSNIGVLCGLGAMPFDVIDLDRSDIDPLQLLHLKTPRVQTGKGWHIYVQHTPGLKNAVKYGPLGPDGKMFHDFRTLGGYAVLPPSVHETGRVYQWADGHAWDNGILAKLPPIVWAALRAKQADPASNVAAKMNSVNTVGGRNDSAAAVAGKLLLRFKTHEWDSEAWPQFQDWNAQHNVPPLHEQELRATWESIKSRESRRRELEDTGKIVFNERSFNSEATVTENGLTVGVKDKEADGTGIFAFTEVEQVGGDEIRSVLNVSYESVGNTPIPFIARLNILSLSARGQFAAQLNKSFGKDHHWDLMLSRACQLLQTWLFDRDEHIALEDAEIIDESYLLSPLIVKGSSNLLFGKSGTGKSYLTIGLAMCLASGKPFLNMVPIEQVNTLFVDYETNASTYKRRKMLLAKGNIGITDADCLGHLFYLPASGRSFSDLIPAIKKIIQHRSIGLVVIDSAALACGGEPEQADSANRYFNALSRLDVTTLTVAHETKQEQHAYPFGSVFWFNIPRNIWNIQSEVEPEDSARQVGLFHRKASDDKLHATLAVRWYYGDDFVDVGFGDKGAWEQELSIPVRILRNLRDRPMTSKELIGDLDGVEANTIRITLKRLKRAGKVKQPFENDGAIWELVDKYVVPKPSVGTAGGYTVGTKEIEDYFNQ